MDTTRLVQLHEYGEGAAPEVEGAIVKVTPTLRASQRETFDKKAVEEELLESGARAVLVLPKVVPDELTDKGRSEVVEATRPEDAIRAWFTETKGVPAEDREGAQEMALELLAKDTGGKR